MNIKKLCVVSCALLFMHHGYATLSVETINKLIKKFGPLFKIHPTDESSPASVHWMLKHSSLNVRNRATHESKQLVKAGALNERIIGSAPYNALNQEGEYYLNLEGNKEELKKGPGYDKHNLSQQDCYVNAVERENGNVVLQFWCFYPWQGSIVVARGFDYFLRNVGYHEGDWEHVNIYLNKTDHSSIGYELNQVFFARHQQKKGDLVKKGSSRLKLVNDAMQEDAQGTHPVVYVGKNSHGTYPYVTRLSKDVDQTSAQGPSLKGWERGKYIGTLAQPQPGHEWINFWGRWGSTIEALFLGISYHGDSPETPFLYNSFMHQGFHKKPIEIKGQNNNFVMLINPHSLKKSKRYSNYFTFNHPPKRIRLLEWRLGHVKTDDKGSKHFEPIQESITYELWEKKTLLADKQIADGFSSKEPKLTPVYDIKNLYIANVKRDGKDIEKVPDFGIEIRLVED